MIPSSIRTGDRVRITRVRDYEDGRHVGRIGIVSHIQNYYRSFGDVTVEGVEGRGHGGAVRAEHVVKVEAIPATDPALDPRRVAAARTAAELLGSTADLDALIRIGDFVLGEHVRSGAVETLSAEIGSATVTPVPDPHADRELVGDELELRTLSVRLDRSRDNDVVAIDGSYVQRDQVERLIAYLQAAVRVHDATPAFGGTVTAPF